LFLNEEVRLRAGWRLLLQFLLYTVGVSLLGPLTLAAVAGLSPGAAGRDPSPYLPVVVYAGAALAATASVWACGRSLDGRPFSGFGLRLDRAWWADLGFGLLVGALLMTGIFLAQLAAGWATVTGSFVGAGGGAFFPAILAPAALFVCVGFYEELVSRGYQLTNLAEGLNGGLGPRGAIVLAWVLSSSFFAGLHLFNPNTSASSTLNIFLAGMMLGSGYVLTGRLAIPIGLHITWNFFQGNVFGFPVSGLDLVGASFVSTRETGPDLLTGGPFGPEAGLIAPVAMVVGVGLVALRVRRRTGKLGLHLPLAEGPSSHR